MLKRSLFLILLILFVIPMSSLADIGPEDRTIDWQPITHVIISDTRTVTELSFSGASYNVATANLPVYSERFKIGFDNANIEAFITNQQWEDLNESDMKRLDGHQLISSSLNPKTLVGIERKQAYAVLSFVPLRLNANTGQYQKLVSFTLRLRVIEGIPGQTAAPRAFKQNSVLASGNWFKVAVQFTGIHVISYDDLSSMGLNPSSINPRNLRVYGNGGGMLPEPNADFRYDDLMENSIIVSGEDDGIFNEGDYILFYAESPNTWTWDGSLEKFVHSVNLYSNYTYYFINADLGPGKRIQSMASTTQPATHQVNKFTDMSFIEDDDVNIVRTGRDWFEYPPYEVQTSKDYSFSFPDIDISAPVNITGRVAARSSTASTFKYYLGNVLIHSLAVGPVSFTGDEYAKVAAFSTTFNASGPNLNIKVDYSKPLSASTGWMDYIALNVRRNLKFSSGQMSFRDPLSMGAGNIAEYTLANANASTIVWDVSDPLNIKKINGSLSGSNFIFRLPADTLNEFIAYNGTSYYSVSIIGKIANQNLHGINTPDFVIIANGAFMNEATRLANYHRDIDGLDVIVVNVEQVYNEFSSGGQDITAIRDFMKMLYDEASGGEECLYLMLFGDASYDYKNRIEDNSNMVPTWEDKRSMNIIHSIATDDYFGFLDENEGGYGESGILDLGIGRLVVSTQESARLMVDKILHYATGGEDVYGSWRNVVCFVADDEDHNMHLNQAEQMATKLEDDYGDLNIDKIYIDAYPQVSTSGGQRAPLVNQAINQRMGKGALVMNYTGHGGEAGWAHERILEISDINSWTNFDNQPVFITATCEFSRYDDPTRVSAGELVLLNSNGGGVGLFTTARATYGSPNFELNKAMYDYMFEKIDGEYPRFGDLIRMAKNKNGSVSDNDRKFILLGDPAMRLAYPENHVNTIKINHVVVSLLNDTIKALQKVTIEGRIEDENGNVLNAYSGILKPTVFDKPTNIKTLSTDPASEPISFKLLNAVLYKGKASITNGAFSFTFIVPKDIAYNFGYGKISYYAHDANSDANGFYKKIVIGGFDNTVPPDANGPEVQLYMNDENFGFGGITNEDPVLLAYLSDSSGINTVGTGIGHDIVATLDNDNNKSQIINDFYEADIDSYTKGVVKYPYKSLSEGNHSLNLKVWDVYNNSSESYTEFVVASSAELAIEHVLNYPNPFTTSTAFYFDHNQPNSMLEVQVQIFTVAGRLIKTLDDFVMTNGYRSEPIYWDGLDDFGDRIGRGVYIYKLRVRSSDGTYAEKLEKLVILR